MSVATMTKSVSVSPPAAVPDDFIWRFSVAQYHKMIHAGILTDDDKVELLEGWVIPKMPKNPPHSLAEDLARDTLTALLPAGWHVKSQNPITIAASGSEPEPDVAVLRGERRDYAKRHAGPRDLALVIEIADSTLKRDRGLKKRIYARAGIPVYWIVNLAENQLEVYTDPSGPTEEPDYQAQRDYSPDDSVPVVIEGLEIGVVAVRELFP